MKLSIKMTSGNLKFSGDDIKYVLYLEGWQRLSQKMFGLLYLSIDCQRKYDLLLTCCC